MYKYLIAFVFEIFTWSTSSMKMKPNTRLIPIGIKLSEWWWVSVSFSAVVCTDSVIRDLTPSGIITINAVPTKSPAPNAVIFVSLS